YIEDLDRASGIRVVSSMAVTRDALIDVVGSVSISDGERQINCNEAIAMGVASDPPGPLGMRGDFLGGSALNAQTPGITGAYGPNNIGLLVKTWGKVVSASSSYFYIESRPGTNVKVISGSLTQPIVGKIVSITGISSCELVSGAVARAILPRDQADIVILK
ncbi:MAG: single stranded DNA-binding domain-containing protein, partial [Armatimonadota bacterium]